MQLYYLDLPDPVLLLWKWFLVQRKPVYWYLVHTAVVIHAGDADKSLHPLFIVCLSYRKPSDIPPAFLLTAYSSACLLPAADTLPVNLIHCVVFDHQFIGILQLPVYFLL